MNDFWFALMLVLAFFFNGLDAISTMMGLSDGLVEGNKLWQKVLGSKFGYFLKNPFGVFILNGPVALAGFVGFFKLAEALGHNHNADAWVPGAIAAGFLAMFVRNLILIHRKK